MAAHSLANVHRWPITNNAPPLVLSSYLQFYRVAELQPPPPRKLSALITLNGRPHCRRNIAYNCGLLFSPRRSGNMFGTQPPPPPPHHRTLQNRNKWSRYHQMPMQQPRPAHTPPPLPPPSLSISMEIALNKAYYVYRPRTNATQCDSCVQGEREEEDKIEGGVTVTCFSLKICHRNLNKY